MRILRANLHWLAGAAGAFLSVWLNMPAIAFMIGLGGTAFGMVWAWLSSELYGKPSWIPLVGMFGILVLGRFRFSGWTVASSVWVSVVACLVLVACFLVWSFFMGKPASST